MSESKVVRWWHRFEDERYIHLVMFIGMLMGVALGMGLGWFIWGKP